MHPRTRFRARCQRRLRNFRFACLGLYGSLTFPVRKPRMWLMCKYFRVFLALYNSGRPDLALKFGRVWPAKLALMLAALNKDGDRSLGIVL